MKNLEFLYSNIIAHRGFHDLKNPENSIGAFKKAIKKNYLIEFDIHLLKDNTVVVFHDDNLKRMIGINKNIKDTTYEEIKNLKLLNSKYNIPTLKEVLDLVDGKVPIIIELKFDRKVGLLEKEVCKILDNYKGIFCVKCFNPLSVMWFKKHKRNYIRGLLIDSKKNIFIKKLASSNIFLRLCNPDFISCRYSLFKNKKIKKFIKNKPVIAWTIKSKTNYNKYKNKFSSLICENILQELD